MDFSDETLMAYADGELDAVTRAQVDAALAGDAALARRVAAQRALQLQLQSSFAGVLAEPVPQRLLDAARSTAGTASAKVVELRPRPVRRWQEWGALAAGLLLGALGLQLVQHASSPTVGVRNGGLVAQGTLARSLDTQLASNQPATAGVKLGLSFRTRDGVYCRSFELRDSATAGLACHNGADWQLRVLSPEEKAGGQFRQAATSLPPAVLQAIEGSIEGEPLDAAAEARARAGQWQPAAH